MQLNTNTIHMYKGLLRYGLVRNYGTVRFGKKYDTELRTEFLEKVRYGTELRYYIFRTVPYSFRTPVAHALHFCFQVLHFSFLPMTLTCQLRSPLTLTTRHPSQYFK